MYYQNLAPVRYYAFVWILLKTSFFFYYFFSLTTESFSRSGLYRPRRRRPCCCGGNVYVFPPEPFTWSHFWCDTMCGSPVEFLHVGIIGHFRHFIETALQFPTLSMTERNTWCSGVRLLHFKFAQFSCAVFGEPAAEGSPIFCKHSDPKVSQAHFSDESQELE